VETFVPLKTSLDVDGIRKACRLAEMTLHYLREFTRPGVSSLELDRLAGGFLQDHGARGALDNGFPGTVCVSVNNVAVHGVPSADEILADGDIVTVDLTVELEGWCGDAAWSYLVGDGSPEHLRLLAAAWRACVRGVAAVRAGAWMGDIGHAVQQEADRQGCRVIEEFAGHGIGRRVHEDPLVPHVGRPGTGRRILPGMVLTVEPTLTIGEGRVDRSGDGWGLRVRDGMPTAQFEHTVAVFRDRTEVLTFSRELREWADFPPYC
jgi:methionyl aminopeptidase